MSTKITMALLPLSRHWHSPRLPRAMAIAATHTPTSPLSIARRNMMTLQTRQGCTAERTRVGFKLEQVSMSGRHETASYFREGTIADAVITPAYTFTARLLHWTTAVLILSMIPLGVVIANEWGDQRRTLSLRPAPLDRGGDHSPRHSANHLSLDASATTVTR